MNSHLHLLFVFRRHVSNSLLMLVWLAASTNVVGLQTESATTATQEEPDGESLLDLEWVKMNPTGSRSKFEMPVQPRFVERTMTPVRGAAPIKVRLYIGTTKDGTYSFVVSYNDLPESPRGSRGVNNTLEGAVRGSYVNVNGQLVTEIDKIKLGNVQGRQFGYVFTDRKDQKYVVLSRVFLKGRRLYQLTAIGTKEKFKENVAAEFLNSFKIVRPKPDLPPVPKVNQ